MIDNTNYDIAAATVNTSNVGDRRAERAQVYATLAVADVLQAILAEMKPSEAPAEGYVGETYEGTYEELFSWVEDEGEFEAWIEEGTRDSVHFTIHNWADAVGMGFELSSHGVERLHRALGAWIETR